MTKWTGYRAALQTSTALHALRQVPGLAISSELLPEAGLGRRAQRAHRKLNLSILCHTIGALLILASATPLMAQRVADNQDRYDDIFRKYSKRFFGVGFDWHYFKAQGLAESGLDPKARSPVGARGVMQLMPGTYAIIKKARSEQFGNIEDPEWNIAAGILFNRDLWHVWADTPDEQERLRFMFGSYNAGQGTIKRATSVARARKLNDRTWKSIEQVAPNVRRWRYTETLPYVRKIEEHHRTLNGANRNKLRKKP